MTAMSSSGATLRVQRAPFSIDDPWEIPAGCHAVSLRNAMDGSDPRQATTLAVYHDSFALCLLFSMQDDAVVATHFVHDAPLYEEDVVEAFLAPERMTEYLELEANPLGTTFDARIFSPDGVRRTMRADLSWDCTGLEVFIRRVWLASGTMQADTLVRIPFAGLGRSSPPKGESWRGNFFRIDRSAAGDEFSAWRPTMKTPADFHVTAAFGVLIFE